MTASLNSFRSNENGSVFAAKSANKAFPMLLPPPHIASKKRFNKIAISPWTKKIANHCEFRFHLQ